MSTVKEIYETMCRLAPPELQMSFDNAGFLLGHGLSEVDRALLALDVTDDVIDEALSMDAELIISHHPLIFQPLKSMTDDSAAGRRLLKLAENRIAVISMHTNLDNAEGGVNDVLLALLGAEPLGVLDEDGCGRIGLLPHETPMEEFLPFCKEKLQSNGLRYWDAGKPVRKLAVMGGSGADCIGRAASLGCDTYVTADIKYHQFQTAVDLGINLIDGDHFCTENPVIYDLQPKLAAAHPDVCFSVSKTHRQIIRFA